MRKISGSSVDLGRGLALRTELLICEAHPISLRSDAMKPRSTCSILCLGWLALVAVNALPKKAAADEETTTDALALIDDLVIAGETTEDVTVDQLSVLREGATEPEAGHKGMPLVAGDEIRTGPGAQAVLRFLDPQADVEPWLLVDESSVLRLVDQRSVESLLGRLFATLKGLFTVLTPQGPLGVEGTEFEIVLGEDGSVDVQVLEGVVEFKTRRIQPLQRLSLRPGKSPPSPAAMPESKIETLLDWTTNLMVKGQPSYAALGSPSHFATPDERETAFRDARSQAIRHRDANAKARLAEIYNDWGEGKRAAASYRAAANEEPAFNEEADFLSGWAQANRRAGRLEQAQEKAEAALQLQPDSGRARLALGKTLQDRASVSANKKDRAAETDYLEQSLLIFSEARRDPRARGEDAGAAATHAARVSGRLAILAEEEGKAPRAELLILEAEDLTTYALELRDADPRAMLERGDLDQMRAQLARQKGDVAGSKEALEAAERSARAALRLHPDLAPAHYQLGTVWEARGPEHTQEAIAAYEASIRAQPTYYPAYYRLSLLKQAEDPVAAARYLDVYRKLAPDELEKVPPAEPLPDFRGQNLFAAGSAITRLGLRNSEAVRETSSRRPGTVIAQQPPAGSPMAPDTIVTLTYAVPGETFKMPNLIGLSEAEARARIFVHALVNGEVTDKINKHQSSDAVIRQSPKAGKRVDPGDKVDWVIAVPSGQRVPGVEGSSLKSATQKLKKKKLKAGKIAHQTSCEPGGTVLLQSPGKGRRLPLGSSINLVVASLGPDPVTVPKLLGTDRALAARRLQAANLSAEVHHRESERPKGTVIDQHPRPTARLAAGCPVRVVLAKPIPLVVVPNLVGQRFEDVQRAFRSRAGVFGTLGAGRVRQVETQRVPHGTVIGQQPIAGARVKKKTLIHLDVAVRGVSGNKTPTVKVPRVNCLHIKDADNRIRRAGLRPAHEGRGDFVIRQRPSPDHSVSSGSTVTLFLGSRGQCDTYGVN